ncbi:hypothetical protein L1987_86099 [Smallanthus sonchifolius]|uniref:Uncharacterized protein n=1 Tax=Smallanthus sonchifolius TaxID=185202 RepID=A0ACB8XZY5_9ASTR|nr:hypothetical protein L1987_86099 [Smallanthus sonchifolius]
MGVGYFRHLIMVNTSNLLSCSLAHTNVIIAQTHMRLLGGPLTRLCLLLLRLFHLFQDIVSWWFMPANIGITNVFSRELW